MRAKWKVRSCFHLCCSFMHRAGWDSDTSRWDVRILGSSWVLHGASGKEEEEEDEEVCVCVCGFLRESTCSMLRWSHAMTFTSKPGSLNHLHPSSSSIFLSSDWVIGLTGTRSRGHSGPGGSRLGPNVWIRCCNYVLSKSASLLRLLIGRCRRWCVMYTQGGRRSLGGEARWGGKVEAWLRTVLTIHIGACRATEVPAAAATPPRSEWWRGRSR